MWGFQGKWMLYCTVEVPFSGSVNGFLFPSNGPQFYMLSNSAAMDPNFPPESVGIFNVYLEDALYLQNDSMLRFVAYLTQTFPTPPAYTITSFVISPDEEYADSSNAAAFAMDSTPFLAAQAGAEITAAIDYQGQPIGCTVHGGYFTLANADDETGPITSQFTIKVVTPNQFVIASNPNPAGYDLTHIDLTNILDFEGADLRLANFTGAILSGVSFAQTKLAGADLANQDLTKLYPDTFSRPPTLQGSSAAMTNLSGSTIPFSMLGLDWSWIDLTNATITGLPSSLDGLKATGARLAGLNKNTLTGLSLKQAVLDYAILDGLGLANANLTGASMIDASMHGTILTNAILVGATMTGAQLGAIGSRFTLPLSLQSSLDSGSISAISPVFAQNGVTLSASATLSTQAMDRVWKLDDAGNNVTYTIRLETKSDGTQALTVYEPAVAASLVGAYMPNAKLTGANLFAVAANGAQFYADTGTAAIDGSAILEEADFSDANLSGLNLTQAQLLGTHFGGAQLFNAQFNKANLTPAASGVATDLSGANLQGADFTDAQLYGAMLANAAVAVATPSTNFPNQGGVYLFSLPYVGDTATLQDYSTELTEASAHFSLNPKGDAATLQKYVTALQSSQINVLKVPFLEQQPPIKLSTAAQVQTVSGETKVWQIVDGSNSYTLWESIDGDGNTELYAGGSLTNLRAAFEHENQKLRWQASASADTARKQWSIDNDSENPQNLDLGFVRFVIILNGNVLDVYGTSVRVERLGASNELVIDTESCNVTTIDVNNMNSETSCPNGSTLAVNQQMEAMNWDVKWLRAKTPPAPPTCVPTDNSWCPQVSLTKPKSSKI